MSQLELDSCIHDDPKSITNFEFENKKFTRLLCQNCVNFIKNSKYWKIIDKTPLKNLEHL